MNSVGKQLFLSCAFTAIVAASILYKLSTFGPVGKPSSPPVADSTTRTLPRIDQAYAELKEESAALIKSRNREINPFYTDHFEPPPPPPPPPPPEPEPEPEPEPPPPPPPPPVLTRQVSLRYQGFFETTDGVRQAYVQKEGVVSVLEIDEPVLEPWKVAEILPRELVLVDPTGEELRLHFNEDKNIEVKIDQET